MGLLEAGEMYLETRSVLSKKMSPVRSIDVVNHMGYSKPSVSRAVGLLKNDGFITVDGAGAIELTEKGKEIAEKIYERHVILSELLMSLGVDEETATEDACRVEHYLSDKTFEAIKNHRKQYRK